jgi:hypothetical protein
MCRGLGAGEFTGHELAQELSGSDFSKIRIKSPKGAFDLSPCDADVKYERVSAAINRKLNVHVSSACYQNCYHLSITLSIEQKKAF